MILRDEIIEEVKTEIFGPSPGHANEKEVISENPLIKYITGILEPHQGNEPEDNLDEEEEDGDETSNGTVAAMASATAVSQNSFGFSFFISSSSKKPLKIKVTYGTYNGLTGGTFAREPHTHEEIFPLSSIAINKPVKKTFHEDRLMISVHERDASNRFFDFSGKRLLTVSIVNQNRKEIDKRPRPEDCFFQVLLSVIADDKEAFVPYADHVPNISEDDINNRLLYRDVRNYSNGHNCSVDWKLNKKNEVTCLTSTFIPQYELFPLNHREISGLELEMLRFNQDKKNEYANATITKLLTQYREWIETNKKKAKDVKVKLLQDQAYQNIKNCEFVLGRMQQGLDLLNKNKMVQTAFQYMNWSMLFQQLRYGLEERQWSLTEGKLQVEPIKLPVVESPDTWPGYDPKEKKNKKYGKWRPFQLAFVLMNLKSIVEADSLDREIVDLIWFPTGGGKTEAYLGLTAFSIFYNRLSGTKGEGTDVIMRYTLRLLTTEQFQRAASLICACDLLRQKKPELGSHPISIGLWVGGDVTPNKHKQAMDVFDAILENNGPYKFVMLKCPCCGKRMGKIRKDYKVYLKGVRQGEEKIYFTCYDECEYSGQKMPIEVVDEYIYRKPCTLVIATVDKFAQLPWEIQSRKILGVDFPAEGNYNPPTLIIQDELHLISGPLGSMVGLYETLIEYLVTDAHSKKAVKPKIVASTATIALAKEQIKALYARSSDKICIFPTPCIDHDDNFFAFLDNTAPGRKYVGIYANNSPSFKTTQVRAMSILLQAPYQFKEKYGDELDPYYTLVTYFNRTQDLAYAVTFCEDDIKKRLREIHVQNDIAKENKRYLNNYEELTGRLPNEEIPAIRQKMAVSYPNKPALDVCLATNMISVGIDIPRLSLMCMVAQPRSTAEYIQASSRVGRDKSKPGLVFMLYNAKRSRDRSHFEKYLSYHNKIYSYVEASGVTPFSLPAVERGLAGIIVGMLRLKEKIGGDSTQLRYPSDETVNKIKKFLLHRCAFVDPLEVDRMEKTFDELMERWRITNPTFYGKYFPDLNGPQPLMIPYSTDQPLNWKPEPWRVLESLRNVDKEILLYQIQRQSND